MYLIFPDSRALTSGCQEYEKTESRNVSEYLEDSYLSDIGVAIQVYGSQLPRDIGNPPAWIYLPHWYHMKKGQVCDIPTYRDADVTWRVAVQPVIRIS